MKAFLLAAGLGKRLRPHTYETPKCLLPIGGKPLLQIWLENIERHGIKEVLVNTHWLPEKVEAFLNNRRGMKLKVTSFYERRLLGSAGTLQAHQNWVSDGKPFFILYADNYTDVNLSAMMAFHQSHDLPFTLGVFTAAHPERCGIAEVVEDGLVRGFEEKPRYPKSNLAAAGIYVTDCRVFDFFPRQSSMPAEPLDLGFHVIPRLVGNMKAYNIAEFLMDIGTPESYARAQQHWAEKRALSLGSARSVERDLSGSF